MGDDNLQRVTVVKYANESKNMVRGTAEVIPDPRMNFGDVYKFQGLGAFFSDNYYAVTVTHNFTSQGYKQQVEAIKQTWDGTATLNVDDGSYDSPRPSRKTVTPTTNIKTHTVVSGETLWSIAYAEYGDYNKWTVIEKTNHALLVQADARNADGNGHWIYSGMKLVIP